MKLSSKSQYAIQAMLKLAINFNGEAVTLTEIASKQKISLSYLEQLFSNLKKAGLVQGVRGPGGGYLLNMSPNKITIADIIASMEPAKEDSSENYEANTKADDDCLTELIWSELSEQLNDYLKSISLADLVKGHVILKDQFSLDETTRRISSMFPVSSSLRVA